jgi:hypothetical protein
VSSYWPSGCEDITCSLGPVRDSQVSVGGGGLEYHISGTYQGPDYITEDPVPRPVFSWSASNCSYPLNSTKEAPVANTERGVCPICGAALQQRIVSERKTKRGEWKTRTVFIFDCDTEVTSGDLYKFEMGDPRVVIGKKCAVLAGA